MAAPVIVVVPAWNEAPRLPGVLDALRAARPDAQVVVVDDGSVDATAAVAAAHGAHVISHPFNLGYGAAVQTGYKWALARGADLVVQMDADGQHDPGAIDELVAPILSGDCDLVLGSRFLEETGYAMGGTRTLGRKLFGSLGRMAGLEVTDPTSGFQAMNRRVLELYVQDFFPPDYPDVDVLVAASRAGLRIRECATPMKASPRASTLHGGLRALYYVYKMLVSLWATSSSRGGLR